MEYNWLCDASTVHVRTLIWEKDTPTPLWNTLVRMKRLWNVLIIIRNAKASSREYWMTFRGLGFLAVIWFGSSLTPSLCSKLERPQRHTERLRDRDSLGGGGKEPNRTTARMPVTLINQYSLASRIRCCIKKLEQGTVGGGGAPLEMYLAISGILIYRVGLVM